MKERKRKEADKTNYYLIAVPTGPRKQLTGFDDDTE